MPSLKGFDTSRTEHNATKNDHMHISVIIQFIDEVHNDWRKDQFLVRQGSMLPKHCAQHNFDKANLIIKHWLQNANANIRHVIKLNKQGSDLLPNFDESMDSTNVESLFGNSFDLPLAPDRETLVTILVINVLLWSCVSENCHSFIKSALEKKQKHETHHEDEMTWLNCYVSSLLVSMHYVNKVSPMAVEMEIFCRIGIIDRFLEATNICFAQMVDKIKNTKQTIKTENGLISTDLVIFLTGAFLAYQKKAVKPLPKNELDFNSTLSNLINRSVKLMEKKSKIEKNSSCIVITKFILNYKNMDVDEQLRQKMIENLSQFDNKLKNSAKTSLKKLKKNSTLTELLPNNFISPSSREKEELSSHLSDGHDNDVIFDNTGNDYPDESLNNETNDNPFSSPLMGEKDEDFSSLLQFLPKLNLSTKLLASGLFQTDYTELGYTINRSTGVLKEKNTITIRNIKVLFFILHGLQSLSLSGGEEENTKTNQLVLNVKDCIKKAFKDNNAMMNHGQARINTASFVRLYKELQKSLFKNHEDFLIKLDNESQIFLSNLTNYTKSNYKEGILIVWNNAIREDLELEPSTTSKNSINIENPQEEAYKFEETTIKKMKIQPTFVDYQVTPTKVKRNNRQTGYSFGIDSLNKLPPQKVNQELRLSPRTRARRTNQPIKNPVVKSSRKKKKNPTVAAVQMKPQSKKKRSRNRHKQDLPRVEDVV